MSDLDPDKAFEKFETGNEDNIRPIDTAPPQRPREAKAPNVAGSVATGLTAYVPSDEKNLIRKGDYIDLLEREPSLRQIYVAAGWEKKTPDQEKIDIDLSCFLVDKNEQTRVNEDFVFYNNEAACDGAVRHYGDSRTGAGDGDDEMIFLDLNGIPFDVLKIIFVLSVYDENRDGMHLGMMRDVYIRLIGKEGQNEIVRLPVGEIDLNGNAAVLAMNLIREGPRWYAEALLKPIQEGLVEAAQSYGIVVREETG